MKILNPIIVIIALVGVVGCELPLSVSKKRKEQSEQLEQVLDELSKTCPNPVCDCEKCDCKDCECNLEDEVPAVVATITMHSIEACPACKLDKANFCIWLEQGWRVEILDDGQGEPGKLYPWYEIKDGDGLQFSFTGRLTKEAIERGRNAARSN